MTRQYWVYGLYDRRINVNGSNLQDLDYCRATIEALRDRYVWILHSRPTWIRTGMSRGFLPELRVLDTVEGLVNAKRRKIELLIKLTGINKSPDEQLYINLPRGTSPRHYYIRGQEQEENDEDE